MSGDAVFSSKWSKLLWVDCGAGAAVGVTMFLASGWLSAWYRLPQGFLWVMGGANLTYAAYSFSLALRARRPRPLIVLLVAANLTWAVLCFRWAFIFAGDASALGLAHLVGEGVFVGGLALLEWRWRELLWTANPSPGGGTVSSRP